ncbi:hypothetical protein ES703_119118 [subsurface metagenome]
MNLPKAIAIKKRYQYILIDASLPELIEADNISIEALKRELYKRQTMSLNEADFLPGETEN